MVRRRRKSDRTNDFSFLFFSSSVFYCLKLIFRSNSVIDLSIGSSTNSDERGCRQTLFHYTLFSKKNSSSLNLFLFDENFSILESEIRSDSSCPNSGVYQTFSEKNSVASPCSTGGQRILSIGCSTNQKNQLTLTSSCRHDLIVDVQLITSINGICLATWRVDQRFQRTLVLYENKKAFCLVRFFSVRSFRLIDGFSSDSTGQIDDRQLDFIGFQLYKV